MTRMQNNKFNPIIYFFVCLIVMIMFDFISTSSILHNIYLSTENYRFFEFVYVQNTGAAFSSFQHSTVFLSVISILAIIGIMYELFKDINKYSIPMYFCSAMLTAGIFCNTYERIVLGYVRDFISLKFIEFPVFNISDILINASVFAIMLLIITKKYKKYA